MTAAKQVVVSRMRSILFAPGNRPEVVAKMPRFGPDIAVVDLEDAIPAAEKASAGLIVAEAVRDLHRRNPDQMVFVRVNQAKSDRFASDLAEASSGGADGLVLPKTEDASDLKSLAQLLHHLGQPHMPVICGLETVAGVARAEELCSKGTQQVHLQAVYFGAEDFVADLGGYRTAEGLEVLYARSRVAIAARLAGVAAIDQAVVDIRSAAAFEEDARRGKALGFSGKLCVHPSQVPVAKTVFHPTSEEVARAREILVALDRGVAVMSGQMVDEAHARRARATLVLAAER